jgi:hypothetical protein
VTMHAYDRAQRVIAEPSVERIEDILADAVQAADERSLGAVWLLLEHRWAEPYFATRYSAIAAAASLAWGSRAISRLGETAIARISDPLSPAIILVLTYASIDRVDLPYLEQLPLAAASRVASAIRESPELRETCWVQLQAILGGHQDDAIVGVATEVIRTFSRSDDRPLRALIVALSLRWLRLGPQVIREYEELIVSKPCDEPAFQEFLKSHPQLIDPLSLVVHAQPDIRGVFRPDFLIRRTDDSHLVVEIETPGKKLMTKAGTLTHEATHANQQVADYITALVENMRDAREAFPGFYRADGLALIGLERDLSSKQRRNFVSQTNQLKTRIAGFDWLATRARAILRNIVDDPIVARSRLS